MDIKQIVDKLKNSRTKTAKKSTNDNTSKPKQKSLFNFKMAEETLFTSLFAAATLLTLFFAYLTYNNFISQQRTAGLHDKSAQLANTIEQKLVTINQVAAELVKENPNDDQIATLIKENVPNNLRVIRVTEPIADIMPDPEFPGINFATLDMLQQTSKAQQEQLPEIHLYGQKNQYLNYVLIQQPEHAYVVVSYPVTGLIDKNAFAVKHGEIDLVQKSGRWSTITLQQWGQVANTQSRQENEIKIPNSNFYVVYASPQVAAGLFKLSLLGSIIATFAGILLSVALFMKRQQRVQQLSVVKSKQQTEKVSHYVPRASTEKIAAADSEFSSEQQQMTHKKPPEPSIFKAYDIRGIVDKTLTADAVMQIGQAIGSENINRGRKSLVVARDGRLSGPSLLEALIKGVQSSGCDVINIGAVPTGVLYFATHHLETGSGVMLTGSHNPPEYNGLKIML